MNQVTQRSQALRFVILLGIVSLCADATYEGGRSLAGAYMGFLGASGSIVGLVAGSGELVGFALRLGIGYLSDKTRQYWLITTLGYLINTGAIPLLALTGRWETVAFLLITERAGRAVRSPPRDVLLSNAATHVGKGFGFGLHEALDQIGAVGGPILVASVFALRQDYRASFAVLGIPALVGLIVLLWLQRRYLKPEMFEIEAETKAQRKLPRHFWIYLAGVGLIACGYADFPLIAFHFHQNGLMQTNQIPLFYALAMGSDAVSALIWGRLFDRIGLRTLVIVIGVSAWFAPLVFLGQTHWALLGMILWGIGTGAQESIFKAAVATLIPSHNRGIAFGIYYLGFGLAWFLGSTAMGVFYDVSLWGLVAFSLVLQLTGIPIFWIIKTKTT